MCIGPAISSSVRIFLFLYCYLFINITLITNRINLQINKSDAENILLPLENPFPQLTNGFLGKNPYNMENSGIYVKYII